MHIVEMWKICIIVRRKKKRRLVLPTSDNFNLFSNRLVSTWILKNTWVKVQLQIWCLLFSFK